MVKEQTHPPVKLDAEQRADLVRRAMVAWLKSGGQGMPTDASCVKMRLGRGYAVLHGTDGVLAVYRVRPDNMALRVLKRWPVSLES